MWNATASVHPSFRGRATPRFPPVNRFGLQIDAVANARNAWKLTVHTPRAAIAALQLCVRHGAGGYCHQEARMPDDREDLIVVPIPSSETDAENRRIRS